MTSSIVSVSKESRIFEPPQDFAARVEIGQRARSRGSPRDCGERLRGGFLFRTINARGKFYAFRNGAFP